MVSTDSEESADEKEDTRYFDVVYKAPCGQSLRDLADVMHFLVTTESYNILQVSRMKLSDLGSAISTANCTYE